MGSRKSNGKPQVEWEASGKCSVVRAFRVTAHSTQQHVVGAMTGWEGQQSVVVWTTFDDCTYNMRPLPTWTFPR
jgi:hypothetical protein